MKVPEYSAWTQHQGFGSLLLSFSMSAVTRAKLNTSVYSHLTASLYTVCLARRQLQTRACDVILVVNGQLRGESGELGIGNKQNP
jgi:hypothetical protein